MAAFLVLIALAVIVGLVFLFKTDYKSNYSKTGSWADFDPGKDTKNVRDSKSAMDNTMKEQFLNDLMDDKK